jgi:hypothetical protein
MDTVAKHLMTVCDLGMKRRLYSGAALSVFDVVSDIYMIVVFLGNEETRVVAYINIACIVLSTFIQFCMTWHVHRKRSGKRIARELLYVVTFVKPGFDAAKVAGGNGNDDGLAGCDPLQELAYSKCAEIVYESIPAGACANHFTANISLYVNSRLSQTHAAIIQTRAFIVSKERNTVALVSIVISCCTTGFAAASMWFDYDTSPAKRKARPKLAGATPDTSRGLFFLLLVVSGAFQVVAKSFSSALLFIANTNYFFGYMLGDHALYQLYLAFRGDYHYYRPGTGFVTTMAVRITEKLVADFTSCWLMRNPLSIHNAYVARLTRPRWQQGGFGRTPFRQPPLLIAQMDSCFFARAQNVLRLRCREAAPTFPGSRFIDTNLCARLARADTSSLASSRRTRVCSPPCTST